jgi:hypothetical protein
MNGLLPLTFIFPVAALLFSGCDVIYERPSQFSEVISIVPSFLVVWGALFALLHPDQNAREKGAIVSIVATIIVLFLTSLVHREISGFMSMISTVSFVLAVSGILAVAFYPDKDSRERSAIAVLISIIIAVFMAVFIAGPIYREWYDFTKIISIVCFITSILCSVAYIFYKEDHISRTLIRISIIEVLMTFLCVSLIYFKIYPLIKSLIAVSSFIAILSNLIAMFHYDKDMLQKNKIVSIVFLGFIILLITVGVNKESIEVVKIVSATFFMMGIVNSMISIFHGDEEVRRSARILGGLSLVVTLFCIFVSIHQELMEFIIGFAKVFFVVSLMTVFLSGLIAIFYPDKSAKKEATGVAIVAVVVSLIFIFIQ